MFDAAHALVLKAAVSRAWTSSNGPKSVTATPKLALKKRGPEPDEGQDEVDTEPPSAEKRAAAPQPPPNLGRARSQ